MFRRRLTYANVASTMALVLALGGGAYAATGGGFTSGSGVINGCVPKHGGGLVVLKPGQACPKHDVALPFNQAGRAGRNGTNGTNGTNGAAGTNGTNGSNGSNGAAGPPGPTASASATSNTGKSIASSDGDVEVLRTTITTTFPSRIVANGSFELQRSAGNGELKCQLQIAPSGSTTFTPLSQGMDAEVQNQPTFVFDLEIPLTGGATEPAGAYVIRSVCSTGSTAVFLLGDLTAIATAQ